MKRNQIPHKLLPSRYVPKRYLLCEQRVIEAYQYHGVMGGKKAPEEPAPWLDRKQQNKPFVLHGYRVNENEEEEEDLTQVSLGHWVVKDPTFDYFYVLPPKVFSILCREVPGDAPLGVVDPNSDLLQGNEWHDGVPTKDVVGDDEMCWVTGPSRHKYWVTGRTARGIEGMAWRRFQPFGDYKEKKPEPGDVWFNPETGDRACVIGKMPDSDSRIVAAVHGNPIPYHLQQFLDLFPKQNNEDSDSDAAPHHTDPVSQPRELEHRNGKVQEKASRDRSNPVQQPLAGPVHGPGRGVPPLAGSKTVRGNPSR